MFHALARFSVRFRWVIVVIWVLAIPVVLRTLPALSSVVQSDNTQFLPADSPSQQAAQLAAEQHAQDGGTARGSPVLRRCRQCTVLHASGCLHLTVPGFRRKT